MKGNVSGYVCNHGSPSGERDTASPRLWAMLRTQASDEEADDVCSRRHLYCDTPVVTSWAVAGQQVVFLHMYLQTRVTLEAFPVATPRGRSVSFPTRGTMVTYVTWDVFQQLATGGVKILLSRPNKNIHFDTEHTFWSTEQLAEALLIKETSYVSMFSKLLNILWYFLCFSTVKKTNNNNNKKKTFQHV